MSLSRSTTSLIIPPRERLLGRDLPARVEVVAAAGRAEQHRPDHVDAVPRHDADAEVRLLEDGVGSAQDDVAEKRELAVDRRRSVHGGDHGHADVEQAEQEPLGMEGDRLPGLGVEPRRVRR